jgi:hypothetical protein
MPEQEGIFLKYTGYLWRRFIGLARYYSPLLFVDKKLIMSLFNSYRWVSQYFPSGDFLSEYSENSYTAVRFYF